MCAAETLRGCCSPQYCCDIKKTQQFIFRQHCGDSLCAAETLRGCCSPQYCCDIKKLNSLYSDNTVVIHCVLQKHCGVAAHHIIVVILKNIDNIYSDSTVVIHCVLQKHCGVAAHHNIVVILKTQQFIFRQHVLVWLRPIFLGNYVPGRHRLLGRLFLMCWFGFAQSSWGIMCLVATSCWVDCF